MGTTPFVGTKPFVGSASAAIPRQRAGLRQAPIAAEAAPTESKAEQGRAMRSEQKKSPADTGLFVCNADEAFNAGCGSRR
jgi:hypothetical protein